MPSPAPLLIEAEQPKQTTYISGLPLLRQLDTSSNWSGLGAFKLRLPRYGISAYVHGIASLGFAGQSDDDPPGLREVLTGRPAAFLADFSVFVGAELRDRVFTELQVSYAPSGLSGNSGGQANQVHLDYAQLDLRVFGSRDYLFVRGGVDRKSVV